MTMFDSPYAIMRHLHGMFPCSHPDCGAPTLYGVDPTGLAQGSYPFCPTHCDLVLGREHPRAVVDARLYP